MYIAVIYGYYTNGSNEKRKCINDISILEKKRKTDLVTDRHLIE